MTERDAWLALGSNLGDRDAHLAQARASLAGVSGLRIVKQTPVEETAPLGGLDQPDYLNQMLQVRTSLSATELLGACQAVERAGGRERSQLWASRTLDIDLVRYDDLLCDLPDLTLPHPGLRDRLFWVREIATMESHD